MRIEVGCPLEEFKRYYRKVALDNEWWGIFGFSEEPSTSWDLVLIQNPSQLIVWRENNEVIGHAIWHESNTEEHRKGDPRDDEDKQILRKFVKENKDFIELHEIWLRKEHRGKGYGKKFFEFFEAFIKNKGYDSIIYYANHPAAIAICRKRGYKEDFLKNENEYVFYLFLGKSSF